MRLTRSTSTIVPSRPWSCRRDSLTVGHPIDARQQFVEGAFEPFEALLDRRDAVTAFLRDDSGRVHPVTPEQLLPPFLLLARTTFLPKHELTLRQALEGLRDLPDRLE